MLLLVLLNFPASLSSRASLSHSSDWMPRVCGAVRRLVVAADGAATLCRASIPETPHVSIEPLCCVPICAGISRSTLGSITLSLSLRALPVNGPRRRTGESLSCVPICAGILRPTPGNGSGHGLSLADCTSSRSSTCRRCAARGGAVVVISTRPRATFDLCCCCCSCSPKSSDIRFSSHAPSATIPPFACLFNRYRRSSMVNLR